MLTSTKWLITLLTVISILVLVGLVVDSFQHESTIEAITNLKQSDVATDTTLSQINSKLTDLATETKLTDLATETTLAQVNAQLSGVATDTTLSQVNSKLANLATETTLAQVNAQLSGVATDTTLSQINSKLTDLATETTLAQVNAQLSGVATDTTLSQVNSKLANLATETTLAQVNVQLSGVATTVLDSRLPLNQLGQLSVTELFSVINLKSVYGLSQIRDRVKVSGTSTVTDAFTTQTGEYQLTINQTNTVAMLFSSERGLYQAGSSAITGVGVRLPENTVGDQEVYWGYGEDPTLPDANGFYFGQDSSGMFVAIIRNGVTTKIYQADWNVDRVDGSGPSGRTLSMSEGNIYNIEFTWYGYGYIQWFIAESLMPTRRVVLHQMRPNSTTSLTQPNLPIVVAMMANMTATPRSVYVGGRQFSIMGTPATNKRITTQTGQATNVTVNSNRLHLVSARRKNMYISASVQLSKYQIIYTGTVPLVVEVYVRSTLSGPVVYSTPTNTMATETALEMTTNNSVTLTDGVLIFSGMVEGNTRKNDMVIGDANIINVDIPAGDSSDASQPAVSVTVRTVSGAVENNVNVMFLFSVQEDW